MTTCLEALAQSFLKLSGSITDSSRETNYSPFVAINDRRLDSSILSLKGYASTRYHLFYLTKTGFGQVFQSPQQSLLEASPSTLR